MKKNLFLLLIVGLVLFLAGDVAFAKEVPITENNIAKLVGIWEGKREMSSPAVGTYPSTLEVLEISNDAPVKIKGKLTNHRSREGASTTVLPFDNAVIQNGKLLIKWGPSQYTELSLDVSGDKMILWGNFYYMDGRNSATGRFTFYKKD